VRRDSAPQPLKKIDHTPPEGVGAICARCAPCFRLMTPRLQTLMTLAADIPPEKRSTFLERVGAMLAIRGRGHFDDSDVAEVARLASTGLARRPAA